MIKKLFSILLSLAMVITMMPAISMTAFAEGESNWSQLGKAMSGKSRQGVEGFFNVEDSGNGTYKITLLSDITASKEDSALEVKTVEQGGKNIVLDLNGKILDRNLQNATECGYVICVYGQLTIIDSKGSGKITGGNNTENGGGVYVSGTLNMRGGKIVGNTAQNGGGIYADLIATLVLTGGSITKNKATENGGGLYYKQEMCFAAGTMITMADGTKKAVETLNDGDEVCVFDHESGEVSTAPLLFAWKYPEKHSGVFTLHFTNDIDITVVGGHSFFSRRENKYITITRDNVSSYVNQEFYNVDDARWEKLVGFDYIDGEVDTYCIASEKHMNCVANGMLSNEDGFCTIVTNIFEYGDDLIIDAAKKADDIERYGLWDYENMKYISKELYDALNIQYMSVAFGKGLITPEEVAYLGEYWCGDETEPLCEAKEKTERKLLTATISESPNQGLYVGGTLKIINNERGNLYLSSGETIILGNPEDNGVAAPKAGMYIGITTETVPSSDAAVQVTTNGKECQRVYFFSDNAAYHVAYNGGGYLELVYGTEPMPSIKSYTVKFDMQGHGDAVHDKYVVSGLKIHTKPDTPKADGYIFGGWYKDAACTQEWNWDTDVVTSDMTLYAKWISTDVAKTSIKSLKAGKKNFTVKVKKVDGAEKYQLRYSLKKSMKSAVKKSFTTATKTVKKLKAKKTYYVQVRTLKKIEGKIYYSSWSKAKKVRTK